MGADRFIVTAKGKSAKHAFGIARRRARLEHGTWGYTGTVAEKREFKPIPVPDEKDPQAHAVELLNGNDPRVADKWGPAGCVRVSEEEWLFFGWASS